MRSADVDVEITRDREHGRLPAFGVEADEEHRVAARGVAAFEDASGLGAAVGAEDEEGLRRAAVDGRDDAGRSGDGIAKDFFGDARGGVEHDDDGGDGGDGDDAGAGEQEPPPAAERGADRALVKHWRSRTGGSQGCTGRVRGAEASRALPSRVPSGPAFAARCGG